MIIDGKTLNGHCSCGRVHEMSTKAAIIEEGCLKKFDSFLNEYGLRGKRAALYDAHTYEAVGRSKPKADCEIVLNPENLHANEKAVEEVLNSLEADTQIIAAVGSGTIHDIARYCAKEKNLRFVSCPTAASVDGFCSTVCAMTWHGYKKTMSGVAPELVIADTAILRDAPLDLTLAGIGDIIGKYTALADWKIAHVLADEFFCPVIERMTRKALTTVHKNCKKMAERDPDAIEQLAYALILSGLAMQLMGNSRPASGSEHHISHLIEMAPRALPVRFTALHGEKVGVGTMLVSGIYHRLAYTEDISSFVKPYAFPRVSELEEFYGKDLVPSVLEENKNNCMAKVDENALIRAWPAIRRIIAEIPSQNELLRLYETIHAKKSLGEIGVPDDGLPLLAEFSPTVRNRMTLMRIKRMLDL